MRTRGRTLTQQTQSHARQCPGNGTGDELKLLKKLTSRKPIVFVGRILAPLYRYTLGLLLHYTLVPLFRRVLTPAFNRMSVFAKCCLLISAATLATATRSSC